MNTSPHLWGLPEMRWGVSTRACTRCPARWWDGEDEPRARCVALPAEAVDLAMARRLTGESAREVMELLAWLPAGQFQISDQAGMPALYILTEAGGFERIWLGDWIARTDDGGLRRLTDCQYRDLNPSLRSDRAPRGESAGPGPSSTDVCGSGPASNVPS